ncbi:MAG: lysophospholipase [Pseudomonadota bacterium]|nr:lysophospholipase [Pseudomonadota bacterium]
MEHGSTAWRVLQALTTACAPGGTVPMPDAAFFDPPPRPELAAWASPAPDRRTLELEREGARLRGWFYPAARPSAPWLLFLYAKAMDLTSAEPRARWIRDLGCHVAVFDYRGYGFSDGEVDLAAALRDAVAFYDLVSALAQEQGGDRTGFVYGYSLGSIFASHIASERPVRGLILQAPLASVSVVEALVAAALRSAGRDGVRLSASPTATEAAANARRAAACRAPLLVVHGAADDFIPPAEGRRVFDAAASPDKSLVLVDGADHELSLAGTPAGDAFAAFLTRVSGDHRRV